MSQQTTPCFAAADLTDPTQALLDAVMTISSDLDLRNMLTRIVGAAGSLTSARFGALGVIDPTGDHLVEFVTTGLSGHQRRIIGDLPHGRGVLGLLITDPRPIRLREVADHPDSFDVPPGHPPMGAFLGVPVRIRDTVFGNLYLTEKAGGGEFTEVDEQLVVALAGVAGLAIDNARAYARSERHRAWLEAAALLPEILRPSLDHDHALMDIAAIAQSVSGACTVAITTDDDTIRAVALAPDERQDEARGLVGAVCAVLAHIDVTDPVDIPLGDHLEATVVPLRTHLMPADRMIAVRAVPAGTLPNPDERELMRTFADHAALTLDRYEAIAQREQPAVVSDRERIARDLHDVVIQRLFASGMQLQAASMRTISDDVKERIERTISDLDATIRDVRATIFELQTTSTASLRNELQAMVRDYRPVLGFLPDLGAYGPLDNAVPSRLKEPLLAAVREALSNTARHAHASRVEVRVETDADLLTLVVADDGLGLADNVVHSGLRNLRERAEGLSGALELEANRPRGLRLRWSVPLADPTGRSGASEEHP